MRERLKLLVKISTLILFVFVCALKVYAQSYPVQANIALAPPYSPFLSDYTAAGAQVFSSTLYLRDSRITSYQVKLRLTIEGVGITIRTKANYIPLRPITLYGGESITMFGEDLEEYFDPNNLDFAGISRSQYEKGAKLPEGVYRFTLEVLDYNRSTLVSNKGTAVAWIILNDPPLLNLPRTDTKVKIIDPTNVVFTWSPRHTGSPNSAFTSDYVFKLVEIWPASRNPYDAFLTQQPLYETTTSFTQLVYGPAEPALIPGRKYAWQVQAKDTEGRDLFKNQGKSEVYVFQFGDAMSAPQNFRKDAGSNSSVLNLRWEPAPDGAIPEQYRVRYRKKGDTRGVWYESVTPQLWSPIPGLKADTEYEMQIRSEAAFQYSEYSPLQTFRTEVQGTDKYTCGADDVVAPITNTNLLLALTSGEVITARNFKLLITQVTGSGGNYSGTGWLKVPWFNGAGIRVNFSGPVNTDRILIGGSVESVYNQGSPAAQAIDDANNIGKDTNQFFEKKDSAAAIVKPDYTVPGTIASINVKDDGKIVVVDTEGNESTFEPKKDEKTGKAKDTIVADAAGNSYTVGADGTVTKKSNTSQNSSAPVAVDYSETKEGKLIAEIVKRFSSQLASKITSVRSPVFPKGAGPMADIFSYAPTCMPDNQEQLKIIKTYTDKVEKDKNLFNLLIASVFENQSDKEAIAELAKADLKEDQKFEDVLSNEQLKKAEDVLCPYVTDAAKQEFLESWWGAPYWERAAKILKEQFEDQDLYDDVYIVYGENECKTIAILKISEDASITTEVTFSSKQTDVDIFHILHDTYKVDYLEARDITLESFGEWFWNYMAIKDDKLYHGTSWEAKSLTFFADMLMAAPGTIEGWITGKHWRTGEELAMWEHILGILDVIPSEALAKAGVTALVIKIGSKVIDISKFSQPVKNFISTAYKSGLKLMIKSKDEILIFAGASKKQIGRLLNGVLQDIYWNYGGEKILARLAGIKYMTDPNTKKVVEGSIELVENEGRLGFKFIQGINGLFTDIQKFKEAIERGENVFYVGRHSDISPRPTGVQSHHGVNSVWMNKKYSDYVPNDAPSVYMFNEPNHNATRALFNTWRAEIAKMQNVTIANIDYTKISQSEILVLAERQFDAANVPQIARELYYQKWNDYIKTLQPK